MQQQISGLPAGDARIDHLQKKVHQQQLDLDKLGQQASAAASTSFEQLSPQQQALHRKAFDTNRGDPSYRDLDSLTYSDNGIVRTMKAPKGDVLHQFRQDVKSGKLPTVSWISAPENFSDHPSAPWYGAWYVSEVLGYPSSQSRSLEEDGFLLAYDENDGYFDHIAVPPFLPPPIRTKRVPARYRRDSTRAWSL